MTSSGNIGDQIRDAVQDAVNSQDYSKLQSTIEKSIGSAAANIGRGLAQAQQGIKQAQQEMAREQQRRQEKIALEEQRRQQAIQLQSVYSKTSGLLAGRIAFIFVGCFDIACTAPLATIAALSASWLTAGIAGALSLAGLGLLISGIKGLARISQFNVYRDYIGLREYCYIDELASATGDTPENTLKRVKKMLRAHLFKQAALDHDETMLIMTSEACGQYRQALEERNRRMYQQHMADSVSSPNNEQQPMAEDAKALLARGEAYVAKIRLSNEAIPGVEISRKIDQIENVVRTIFKRAEEHPEVIDDLGQLMDYYLPTTVKLLDAYRELDAQPIQGDNIKKSKREIEGALDTLATAFEKLLDDVFRDMAWDVSSDISVLHAVLAQEGLTGSPFDENGDKKK